MNSRKTRAPQLECTQYGFEWGPVEVSRVAADEQLGVVVEIRTEYQAVTVRATPKGRRMTVEGPYRRTANGKVTD